MSFYGFCHTTFPWLFKLWLRWEVRGTENIPREGKVVLAANHISLLDPPTIGAACPRPVHFMAKEELSRKGRAARPERWDGPAAVPS